MCVHKVEQDFFFAEMVTDIRMILQYLPRGYLSSNNIEKRRKQWTENA